MNSSRDRPSEWWSGLRWAATLRDLHLVDAAGERLVFRAGLAEDADSAVLAGGDDDLEELLGYVAAEANHEEGPSSPGSSSNEAFQTLNEIGNQS